MFDSLSTEASDVINPDVASEVVIHLGCLHKEFLQYFPEISRDSIALVKNPFLVSVDEIDENLQDELIDLRNDSGCKDVFYHSSVTEFLAKMSSSYQNVAKVCLRKLLPFASTYLCESGFSSLLHLKTKARNRLEVEDDLRCALSTTEPNIEKLVKSVQEQVSH